MKRRRAVPGFLLALSVFVSLLALTGAQVTGGAAGPRLLGRLASAMFELQRWTPAHREDLQAATRDRVRGLVDVGGLPVPVSVPTTAVLSTEPPALLDAIAEAAGRRFYEEGRGAFAGGAGAAGDMSISQPARWAITLLREDNQPFWRVALLAGLLACASCAGLVLLSSPAGPANIFRLTAMAGLVFLLACFPVWAISRVAAGSISSPVNAELVRMAHDVAWMGVRDAFAVSFGSLVLLLLLRFLTQPERRYAEWPGPLDEPA